MVLDQLVGMIEQVALEHPEGFTLDVRNLELVKTGIAVAHAETQNQFGFGGLYTCVQHAIYNYGFVGGWRNEKGQMQYDSIRLFTSLPKAIKWGRKQGQIAIYDLDNGWEIIL